MVELYLLTFPRFPLRKKEHKSYFGKNRTHDFRTSRCAGYLLDHSGDEHFSTGIIKESLKKGCQRAAAKTSSVRSRYEGCTIKMITSSPSGLSKLVRASSKKSI